MSEPTIIKKIGFMPTTNQAKKEFLDNWVIKLPLLPSGFGITTADITTAIGYARMWDYYMSNVDVVNNYSKSITKFHNDLWYGDGVTTPVNYPVLTLAASPASVITGIAAFISFITEKIKAVTALYTEAIGIELKIIGTEIHIDPATMQPKGKVSISSLGFPKVSWDKGLSTACQIYVNRNDGAGFIFLSTNTLNSYVDKFPLPAAGKTVSYIYLLIYEIDGEKVGQPSEPVSISVNGSLI